MFVVAVSIGFGMIPLVAPTLSKAAPEVSRTMLDRGIVLASVATLDVSFNLGEPAADGHAAPVVIADPA